MRNIVNQLISSRVFASIVAFGILWTVGCDRGEALLRADTSQALGAPSQVGDWGGAHDVSFALAADESRKILHVVLGEGGKLFYIKSEDGSHTWSEAIELNLGDAERIAVDSEGVVHMVYITGSDPQQVEYRTFSNGVLGEPEVLSASVDNQAAKFWAPRIAVDGADNVHVLYWSVGREGDRRAAWRTAYGFKPSGAAHFEPIELWRDYKGVGLSKYGTIILDEEGNANMFWVSASLGNNHSIERRVRKKSGEWGAQERWPSYLTADWSISAAVDKEGVVHVSTQRRDDKVWKVLYLNNQDDPAELAIKFDAGEESTELYTSLMLSPNGDRWMATGHREGAKPSGTTMPNIAAIYHYDSTKKSWGDKTRLSPEGYLNVSARQSGEPRLMRFNGKLLLFYFEKAPGDNWKLWQREIDE